MPERAAKPDLKGKGRGDGQKYPTVNLVIVESPVKSRPVERSLNGFMNLLGKAAIGELEEREGPTNKLVEDWQTSLQRVAANEGVEVNTVLRQIADGPRYRVVPTFGHFRSLFPHTPVDGRPPQKIPDWRLPQPRFRRNWTDGDMAALQNAYRAFLEENPPRNGDDPQRPETNPARYLGVDVIEGYRPIWLVTNPAVHRELIAAAKKAQASGGTIYLATDPDREGELIAWHVKEVLRQNGIDGPFRRMKYQSVTFGDLARALVGIDEEGRYPGPERAHQASPGLVMAASVREVLDRLIGYPLTRALEQLCLRPIYESNGHQRGVSAGRVQVAALELLMTEEEDALQRLPAIEHTVTGTYQGTPFTAVTTGNRPVLRGNKAQVAQASTNRETRKPQPFLTLADFQQSAYSQGGLSAAKALKAAQNLFQRSQTTYPRTDTRNVGGTGRTELEAMAKAAGFPSTEFRSYGNSAGSQEAHEALRPKFTGDEKSLAAVFSRWISEGQPGTWASYANKHSGGKWDSNDLKAFEVIARRSLAPLLPDAVVEVKEVALKHPDLAEPLAAKSEKPIEKGHLQIWSRDKDDLVENVPAVRKGQTVGLQKLGVESSVRHPRRPAAQGLVRQMDQANIGRPSSTAQLIDKLERRGYVCRPRGPRGGGMTRFGALITCLLRAGMQGAVDLETTQRMEAALDALVDETDIDRLRIQAAKLLDEFYAGTANAGRALGSVRFLDNLEELRAIGGDICQHAAEGMLDEIELINRLEAFDGVSPDRDAALGRELEDFGFVPHGSMWMRPIGDDALLSIWQHDEDGKYRIRVHWLYDSPVGPMTMVIGSTASSQSAALSRLTEFGELAQMLREVPQPVPFENAWQLVFIFDDQTGHALDWDSTFATLRRSTAEDSVARTIEDIR